MKEKIEITENMPEDLKAAITYLNDNNISLSDREKFDTPDDFEESEDDGEIFDGDISEEDMNAIGDSFDDNDDIDFDDEDDESLDDEKADEESLKDLDSLF